MPYEIIFTKSYTRRATKFFKRHPELIGQYEKTLKLLELNPRHPSLRLHRLRGGLSELHSVSINISYRLTIELLIDKKRIIPIRVGAHDDVYSS
jgi:mRNA-degrading endonuclease YafQ of YafQ-DinJ toxin-antitoxin module